MKQYYITFRSVTYAQRGEKLLGRNAIRCSLLRAPRWMEEQGCGYALKIWTRDVTEAVQQLRSAQLPLRRIYVQAGDGQLEEITV